MSKKIKTRIAFICIFSIIPIVVLEKINILGEGISILIVITLTIMTFIFGREYIRDFGDLTKM